MAAPSARPRHTDSAAPSPLEECARSQGPAAAWSMLDLMRRQGQPVTRFAVARLLMRTVAEGRGPGNQGTLYHGIGTVEQFMVDHPGEADEVLFNALLDACYHVKDLVRLEAALRRMEELRVEPSHVTLGILVKAFGQAGDAARVLSLWDKMAEQRCQANSVTHGCMIDACVKCGRQQKAIEIFQDMKRKKEHRNTILYTTLIKGYGMEKDLRRALALFREMKGERVPCNRITYNSIIDVCIRCGDVQAAENLFGEMTAPGSGVEPDLITFSTLLKGYCHAGELDKALQVAEGMKSIGLRTDELVYNTLMDGCVRANDLSAGVGLLAEMVRAGLAPSPITHGILLRLYQKSGGCTARGAQDAVAQLCEHHGLACPSAPGSARERRGRGRRGGRRHADVEKPRHAAGATSWACPEGAPAARRPAALRLAQAVAAPRQQAQPQLHPHLAHPAGAQQACPELWCSSQELQEAPLPAGSADPAGAAAEIGEALRAARAQAARAQAAQLQAAQAQAALAAYKSLGLVQVPASARPAAEAPQLAHWKEGPGAPPAPCGAHAFPNLLQQAARGPAPVAAQAGLASGRLCHGLGVYRASVPPAPPAPALGGS